MKLIYAIWITNKNIDFTKFFLKIFCDKNSGNAEVWKWQIFTFSDILAIFPWNQFIYQRITVSRNIFQGNKTRLSNLSIVSNHFPLKISKANLKKIIHKIKNSWLTYCFVFTKRKCERYCIMYVLFGNSINFMEKNSIFLQLIFYFQGQHTIWECCLFFNGYLS